MRVALGDDTWEISPDQVVFFDKLKSATLDLQVPPPGFPLVPDTPRAVPGAVFEGLLVGVTVDGEPVKPVSARWADADGRFEIVLPSSVAGKTARFWQSRLRAFSRTEARPGGEVDVDYWPESIPEDAPRDLEELELPGMIRLVALLARRGRARRVRRRRRRRRVAAPPGEVITQTTAPPAETGGSTTQGDAPVDGREVFLQNCSGCHTLADAGTTGKVGPNLDEAKPSYERALMMVARRRRRRPRRDAEVRGHADRRSRSTRWRGTSATLRAAASSCAAPPAPRRGQASRCCSLPSRAALLLARERRHRRGDRCRAQRGRAERAGRGGATRGARLLDAGRAPAGRAPRGHGGRAATGRRTRVDGGVVVIVVSGEAGDDGTQTVEQEPVAAAQA